ncbi:MAG: RNA 2',3'-cyclic phosphodiesterase [Candidatus Thorarchaeota archaeon]
MNEKVRAFLSIDIDDDALLSRIAHIQQKLDLQAGKIKLVKRENIHFTLRFLGDTLVSKLDKIHTELLGIQFSPFTIEITGIGAFPSIRRPRVIWVGVTQNANQIIDLKKEIDDYLGNLGYSPEKRKFHAHATFARVRNVRNRKRMIASLESIANETTGTMTVSNFRMTKSTLTSSGPIYETLWEVPATSI